MKHDLKISRLAVICVLCATVSGAYGASSVRSLGGSGTYTSAAAAAADGNSGGASSVRGGSLRVSPSSNVSGTTTSISTDNTTSGRVATSPRLSIGHYLTGGTSVSGGSSIRPIVPGGGSTSGGGSSSGGDGGDVDLSGVNQRLDALESDVDSLFESRDSIDESITDLWSGKQDILTANDGLIEIDSDNVIYINTENLADAMKDAGFSADVDFRVNEGYIEYWDGTTWAQLIALDDLRGPQGEPGESVTVDEVINGIEDDLQAAVNAAVADAVQTAVADEIANADLVTNTELNTALGGYATNEDLSLGLAAKANAADVYTKAEVYNKTEVDTKISDATSDIVGSAEIEQFKTDVANLKTTVGDANSGLVKSVNDLSGDVTALGGELETVSQLAGSAAATATEAASDAASALSGLDNKADKSELANYVTNDALTQKGYVTSNEVSGQIAAATDNMVTGDDLTDALANKADKATTLAGYGITDTYTTAQIDEKLQDISVGGIEGMEQVLAGKQDVANLVQVVSEADTTKYPSGAAVYKELETKANASELDTLEQTVGQLDSTINAEGTGLADRIDAANDAASAAQTAAEEAAQTAESVQASLALKQDVSAREATTITNDETKYPSSAAVTAALAGKADKSVVDDLQTTVSGEDGAGGLVQQISELTTNVTNVTQNVTNITEQVSEITNPDTGVQSQITNITNIIGNGESGLVADVADAKAAAEKASQDVAGKQDALTAEQLNAVNSGITAEKVSVYDGYADTIAGKQDALGYTAENAANKTGSITAENQSSATVYPSVGAITQWTNDRINELSTEGLPVNPDNIGAGAITTEKIADNAVTEDKLSDELNAEIDGKANTADLGDLATKDQIRDADVAADAAISKSKLATDVQNALDNAANAVAAPAGEKPTNSVLGTDGEGNPVWYEIAM